MVSKQASCLQHFYKSCMRTDTGTCNIIAKAQLTSEMAVSAVEATTYPKPIESICGRDERVKVDPNTSPPYNWICYLNIESHLDKHYVASGFKIHLPDINRTAVVTAGHCTYIDGAYAKKITVTFPGQAAITVTDSSDLYASPEYREKYNADYDYGLILLPGSGNCNDGFGWSACVDNKELTNRLVTICGYPADKSPHGSLWITGGEITKCTANTISYMNDTIGGQSGSPVYTWYHGYWTVLGIHSYGGCPNSATRFTREMIFRFLEWIPDCLREKSLLSENFPHVYVRCDGNGVTKFSPSGSGTVNCQYGPPGSYEKFYIYPVEMPPSLATGEGSTCKVVIESVCWKNVFVRLDGEGMKKFGAPGGGKVNYQFGAGDYEIFILRPQDGGTFAIQSAQFTHCFIRLDGTDVKHFMPNGGGNVNCQYYDDPTGPVESYEKFCIV